MRLQLAILAAFVAAIPSVRACAAETTPIQIGVAGPMTGPNAPFGMQFRRGAQQAVDDINAKGGILGRKIVLEVGDDQSSPKMGVAVARKFAKEKVQLVVGHFNSGVTIPASEIYEKAGIPFISPSSTNPKITSRGFRNAFRVAGRDNLQGTIWAEYVKAHFAGKNIAIVDDGTMYGQLIATNAKKALASTKIKIVLNTNIQPGKSNYEALARRLKSINADVVLFAGLWTEAGRIIRGMRLQGLQTIMISGDGIASADFSKIGGDGVIGTLMSFPPDPMNNPAAKEAISHFTGFVPEAYTLYAYAAVQIYAQASEEAKSTDTEQIAAVLHSGRLFQTVLGNISFDGKGDRKQLDYIMYHWNKLGDGDISYSPLP